MKGTHYKPLQHSFSTDLHSFPVFMHDASALRHMVASNYSPIVEMIVAMAEWIQFPPPEDKGERGKQNQ